MGEKIKERNSNIELLRILAMLFIIIHHLIYHNKLSSIHNFNHTSAMVLYSWAKIGVILFILISGYFAEDSKFNIKKFINLLLETLFYLFLFLIFENKSLINLEYIWSTFKQYYFVTGYLIIYALSPILKVYTKRVNVFAQMIAVVLLLIILVAYRRTANIHIIWFGYVYICGIYTKKYLRRFLKFKALNFIIIIITYVVTLFRGNGLQLVNGTNLLCAIAILLLFDSIKINNSKFINNISKYTIGVYLIHDNVFVRTHIIKEYLLIKVMYFTNFFEIYLLIISFSIYFTCLGIDLMRAKLFEKVLFKNNRLNKLYDKINKNYNKLGEA